jgi:F-type H+-transporting ATPase subunit epsilon
MATTNGFHVSVITPERAVLETDATYASLPAHDGELGIQRNRAPMLYRLGAGLLRIDAAEGKRQLFVAGGFAQMVDNRLTILTEGAWEP